MAYVCRICDFIYMPELKQKEYEIKAGFRRLPADWCCPRCGAKKNSFIWIDCIKTPGMENTG
ncbi:MAG: rubredoxin [Spirochaetales bacterium]|nr:rubredoxin [Spirochaetales bacterium]